MIPRVRILSTGSEILQGLYADTNAMNLSRQLFERGFRVVGHSAAPDDRDLLLEAVEASLRGADLVISTGGLGPTGDDLTRDVIASAWGVGTKRDEMAVRMMEKRFHTRGLAMPENNKTQADLPAGAVPLYNHWGTAPGFLMPAADGRPAWVALPGPPREWNPMLERAFADRIDALFPGRPVQIVDSLHTAMTPESTIGEAVSDLFDAGPNLDLTLLAARGHIRIRMIARGTDRTEAEERLSQFRATVLERIGPNLPFAHGPAVVTPAEGILALLRGRGETLAVAESCTGGALAKALTDIPGSSDVFLGGWVVYSNEAKARDLGVDPALIAAHGAVSEPVVRALAESARCRAQSAWAVSISGIAGPGGGTAEKPVGTVWIGIAGPEGTVAKHRHFPGDRESIREWACTQALEYLRRLAVGIDLDALLRPARTTRP